MEGAKLAVASLAGRLPHARGRANVIVATPDPVVEHTYHPVGE
jgi:hypothetical protein